MEKEKLLFYNEYEQFYQMAEKTFEEFCKDMARYLYVFKKSCV